MHSTSLPQLASTTFSLIIHCLQVRDAKASGGGDVAPIPVTVRQLEALVRISESLARMELATVVQSHHVEQAIQLFASSTLDAVRSGLVDTQTFNDEQVRCTIHSVQLIHLYLSIQTSCRIARCLYYAVSLDTDIMPY